MLTESSDSSLEVADDLDGMLVVVQNLCRSWLQWNVLEHFAVQRLWDERGIGTAVGLYCQSRESPSIVDLEGAKSLLLQSSCSIVDQFVVWLVQAELASLRVPSSED